MKKKIVKIDDIIGKTITDVKIHDWKNLILFFDEEWIQFYANVDHDLEGEIYLVQHGTPPSMILNPKDELKLGIISQSEYDEYEQEQREIEKRNALKQYERIKAKYNLT